MLSQKFYFFFVAISAVILVSCSSQVPVEVTDEAATPVVEATIVASPVSPIARSPLPTPTMPPTPTPEVAEPENGKGTVVGIIYDQIAGSPYGERDLYLAKISELQSPEGEPAGQFAELDVTSSPYARIDESGRFVFENVEPGLYGLVVRLPSMQEILLEDAATNFNIPVEVEAGEILDMGIVAILGPESKGQ